METYQINAIRQAFKRFEWLKELMNEEDEAIHYLALETGISIDCLKQNIDTINDITKI